MAAADGAWRDLSRAVGLSPVEYNGLGCPVSVHVGRAAARWPAGGRAGVTRLSRCAIGRRDHFFPAVRESVERACCPTTPTLGTSSSVTDVSAGPPPPGPSSIVLWTGQPPERVWSRDSGPPGPLPYIRTVGWHIAYVLGSIYSAHGLLSVGPSCLATTS